MKKIFIALILISGTLCLLPADTVENNFENDPIFLTDVPVYFGVERFLERIGTAAAPAGTASSATAAPAGTAAGSSPLGLVFSGGAARAFAHIGVLKRLEEEKIVPDFIVANSMGSIVALLYAAGVSPEAIENLFLSFGSDFLFRPGIPVKGGILDPGRFISLLYEIFGELDIRDLKIPVVILSEDLKTRRQIVFMEGDFYSIMQASISMPFSFPPVLYNGMILIDGGISNLTPVEIAADYTDRIIVSTAFYNRENSYTNFISIINRAFDISKTRKGITGLKEINPLLIRCEVETFSFMDFHRIEVIVDRGYESAERIIGNLADADAWRSNRNSYRTDNLTSARSSLDMSIAEVKKNYITSGTIPLKEYTSGFTAGFDMFRGLKDDYYLDNSWYFYLGHYAEIRYFQADLRGYLMMPGETGIDSFANIVLFKSLKLKSRANFSWNDFRYSSAYLYGRAELNLTAGSSGTAGAAPFAAWESKLDSSFEETDYFVRSGLKGFAGMNSLTGYWFSEKPGAYSEGFSGAGAENDFKIRTIGKMYLDQNTVFRITPDYDSDRLKLYVNDGIRASVSEGIFDNILIAKNSLTFRTETSLTFGEIILIKGLAASAFCDYFYLDEGGISTGLSLDLDISFIGLTSLYFTAYAGYDYLNTDVFARVAIGSGN